ncbi:MAG: metallophosphoesterase, partial [Hymenobacter sp.]|nr:metallophosphoesterase [Hymenobacter sp.]
MARNLSPFLFFALVAAAEWYGFQAVYTLAQNATPGTRRGTALLYWGLTALVWGLGVWAISTRREHASFKSYFLGLLMAVLAAKIVLVVPLLLEDLTRLGRWTAQALGRPAGSGPGPVISRSEF